MKLCINCLNYDPNTYGEGSLALCKKSKVTNMVSGAESLLSCQETRETVALCGKDASWFEPIKSQSP